MEYQRVSMEKLCVSTENEIDVVDQPPKKRYKTAYKQARSDRRIYYQRNLTGLDKKVGLEYNDPIKTSNFSCAKSSVSIIYLRQIQLLSFCN